MHVEPPTHAPTNLKELGVHYVMIVLGILTALGLEAGFEALHHRKLARQTVEQVEVELRANLAEVRTTLQENQKTIAGVDAIYAEVKALARQDKPSSEQLSEILNQRLRISIFTPGLRRDAWDTAVADQALMHMPIDALRRLSEAYTAQREAQMAVQTNFNVLGSFARLTDAAVDAEFGRVDAVEALKALRGYRLTLVAITGIERDLARQLAQSLGEAVPAEAAAPASAASAR